MPKTDHDPLGPRFDRMLRAELHRVRPLYSSPRYLSEPHPRIRMWRFAPVALAVSLAGILALSAFVATGSANPAVWTERVVTVIESNPTPTPEASPVQPKAAPQAAPTHTPDHQAPATAEPPERSEAPEPSETPEPARSPEPGESPEPSGNDSSSGYEH